MGSRAVDGSAYLPIVIDMAAEGYQQALTVTGSSMTPFLVHGRDQILFQRPDRPLKRGDMAFFRRRSGACVMHRVCRVDQNGNYYMVGDAQRAVEGPIAPEQVFAVVTSVCRKGKWIGPGSFWWEFFAHAYLRLRPVRPLLLKCYGGISGVWKGAAGR